MIGLGEKKLNHKMQEKY